MKRGRELSQKNPAHQEDILKQTDNLQMLWQQLQDELADRKSRLQAAALIKQVSMALLWYVVWRHISGSVLPHAPACTARMAGSLQLNPASQPGRRFELLEVKLIMLIEMAHIIGLMQRAIL